MAILRWETDSENYEDLVEQTGPAAAMEIAALSAVVDPPTRAGYEWHLFHGNYPDAQKKWFYTRIQLTQVPGVSLESLRLCVTYRPNTWTADNFFPLKTDEFAPDP